MRHSRTEENLITSVPGDAAHLLVGSLSGSCGPLTIYHCLSPVVSGQFWFSSAEIHVALSHQILPISRAISGSIEICKNVNVCTRVNY